MRRSFVVRLLAIAAVTLGGAAALASPPPTSPDRAHEAVLAALAAGGDIAGQAENLAKLAWPQGKRDEQISARARRELVTFGDHSMLALRNAMNSVKPEYTDEVLETAMDASRQARAELSGTHVPIILDALWVGNHAAKAHAIEAIQTIHTPLAVQPLIDSAIEDPSLTGDVVGALGALRYPQSRFYLEKIMMEGQPSMRPIAAASLAQLGGAGLGPLKNALKAPDKEARLLAARALLPVATDYEVGAIYEYIEKHGDDDPAVTAALKGLAANIEKAIAARDANAAAGSPKD